MCILSARRVSCPAERVLHMAATNVPDGFRKSPLCYSLTAEQVEKLFGLFKRKAVAAGGTIFLENMQGEALYLIEKGTVRFRRVPYDIRAAQRAILAAGLPSLLAERLSGGY